ncbi:hypothetical protein JMG10_37585 [Nostoc ellipsosporum NOK]|nr:hypothetical protein [Nostoc ellipsosporum NOK]BAZ47894.1 hypothetical protein NIES4103_04990 [Nostoc sp. NIES-4103]
MLNRAVNLIFVDSFAFVINATLGTVLRSKICNYSWDGKPQGETQTEEIKFNQTVSTPLSENMDDTDSNEYFI